MNIKNKILSLFFLTMLVSCSSAIRVDTKGCISSAAWEIYPASTFDYEKLYVDFKPEKLKDDVHYFIEKRVNTPLGMFRDDVVYLRAILEKNDLSCYDIKTLNITYSNRLGDVLLSFIPFLGTKTIYVYGKLWSKSKFEESNPQDFE